MHHGVHATFHQQSALFRFQGAVNQMKNVSLHVNPHQLKYRLGNQTTCYASHAARRMKMAGAIRKGRFPHAYLCERIQPKKKHAPGRHKIYDQRGWTEREHIKALTEADCQKNGEEARRSCRCWISAREIKKDRQKVVILNANIHHLEGFFSGSLSPLYSFSCTMSKESTGSSQGNLASTRRGPVPHTTVWTLA